MASRVVLVVDDEPLLLMLAGDLLRDAGFEVLEAISGAEAVATMKARPDVVAVVTDVHMPGEPDGIALSHVVRSLCPHCAILVVSARPKPPMAALAERSGWLSKPYRGDRLVSIVEGMLAA